MKIKFEWVAIGVLVLALVGQGAWLNAKMDGQREKLERSAEVANEKIADRLERVGDKIELLTALGGQTVFERPRPGTIVVTTGREGKDGKDGQPGAPGRSGRDGSVVTDRPGSPGQPPTSGGPRPPITRVPAEEARRNARLTHRVTFDSGSLKAGCEGIGLPPDTLEIYTFGDGLGTVSPCVSRLEMTAQTQEPARVRPPQRGRLKLALATNASVGLAWEAYSFSAPIVGRFSVDALGLYSSQAWVGLGVSRDVSDTFGVGIGHVWRVTGSQPGQGMWVGYGTVRF